MRRLRRSLLLVGLALAPAGLASAADIDLAYGALQAGHYRRAQEEALKRVEADNTDAAAMTLLGEIYRQGLGVPENTTAATEWYERAADRGDINAVYALAIALLDQRSSKRDPAKAGQLLERAAAAGHPAANYNLALALLATGKEADGKRAVAALEIAAKANIGDAEHALGVLYKQGRAVPQDNAKAAEWMAKAAESGNVAGEIEYAIMLFNGEGVATDETAAARLFLRAAYKGNAIAQNRIARLYLAGRGIAPDSAEAAAWHLAARAQGLDDPMLDQMLDRMTPEQMSRIARVAADRIEGTALTTPSQPSK